MPNLSLLRRPAGRRAFTLLELLVVVVVLGILALLLIFRMGEAREKAYRAAMQNDLRNFATAQALHLAEGGDIPSTATDVATFAFSEGVYEIDLESHGPGRFEMLVGHNRTNIFCSFSAVDESATHNISCSKGEDTDFDTDVAGAQVHVDASKAIAEVAFAPQGGWGAAWSSGTGSVKAIRWDWGDGTVTRSALNPAVVTTSHTYASSGDYNITLTLLGASGSVYTGRRSVATNDLPAPENTSPTASFAVTTNGLQATFAATGSDPDGDPLSFSWSFGDDATGSGSSVVHNYGAAGEYLVTLVATDGRGGSFTVSDVVVVVSDHPPLASFTYSPAEPRVGEPVTFTATSTDPDGDAMTHSWAFGDGGVAAGPVVTHTYATPATFAVQIGTVAGGQGHTYEGMVTVTPAFNRAPVASFTMSPSFVVQGVPVTLTSTSTDPDGDPLSATWDFNGDGVADANGAQVAHAFGAGAHNITLTVTDPEGLQHSSTLPITAAASADVTLPSTFSEWTGVAGSIHLGADAIRFLKGSAFAKAKVSKAVSAGGPAAGKTVIVTTTWTRHSIVTPVLSDGRIYHWEMEIMGSDASLTGKRFAMCMRDAGNRLELSLGGGGENECGGLIPSAERSLTAHTNGDGLGPIVLFRNVRLVSATAN